VIRRYFKTQQPYTDEPSFQGASTVAPEQQLCGVQVIERVGLVAARFQFSTHPAP
jgi:hypothetical protein